MNTPRCFHRITKCVPGQLLGSPNRPACAGLRRPVKTAVADGWHHGGYGRGGVFFNFGGPVYGGPAYYPRPYYYPRPAYYYPPAPVYYAPPPVYYPPAPVYGAPGFSFGLTVPLR